MHGDTSALWVVEVVQGGGRGRVEGWLGLMERWRMVVDVCGSVRLVVAGRGMGGAVGMGGVMEVVRVMGMVRVMVMVRVRVRLRVILMVMDASIRVDPVGVIVLHRVI